MNSAIYTGSVYHRRFGERAHTLSYRVFYLLLDLDELARLDTVSRLFAVNRRAWFAYHDRDHGAGEGEPLREWCVRTLRASGIDGADANFRVLTTPRVLGYVFNPISIIYCLREDDSIGAMIYEVNNTFGERIAYAVPVTGRTDRIRQRCDKSMFVSPFFELEGDYTFALTPPGDSIELSIDYHVRGERQLRAVFRGERRPFDAPHIAGLVLKHPAASVKIIAGIHFEALKLWLKGVPLVRHRRSRTRLEIGTEL